MMVNILYMFGSNDDENIFSIALFGTCCICLTNGHRSNRYEARIRK